MDTETDAGVFQEPISREEHFLRYSIPIEHEGKYKFTFFKIYSSNSISHIITYFASILLFDYEYFFKTDK